MSGFELISINKIYLPFNQLELSKGKFKHIYIALKFRNRQIDFILHFI